MTKSILYVGNNLAKKTGYYSVMEKLSTGLISEGYKVTVTSNKVIIFFRFIEMLYITYKSRKTNSLVLIDTFSTLSFYYAFAVSKLCKFLNLKYIPILHGGNLPYRLRKSRKLSNAIFSNSYINVAPSEYLQKEFKKKGFKTVLIPNSIDVKEIPFEERDNLTPKLLYVRAFSKIYNPLMALKVLKGLKKDFPTAELCMVGPDKDGSLQQVKDFIKENNLLDSVKLTGTLSRQEWFKLSEKYDFFINTTNVDNMPVSVIEAMALGLTVVSTNAGGMSKLVANGVNGILVDKNDDEGMSNVISKLIQSNNTLLHQKGRKESLNFSWDVIKMKWINLIEEVHSC